jgi:hypothetical protein
MPTCLAPRTTGTMHSGSVACVLSSMRMERNCILANLGSPAPTHVQQMTSAFWGWGGCRGVRTPSAQSGGPGGEQAVSSCCFKAGSRCVPRLPETHDPPASASPVLRLQVCPTVPGSATSKEVPGPDGTYSPGQGDQ